ncbi:hypothetical protein LCGC14_2695750 [marine sediment metagenome]|uniref:Uncharacterized protein n=1 Tax=marine sediment metagenome TaxID=412755 RepID=A0A0F9BRN9_9ZZZZ
MKRAKTLDHLKRFMSSHLNQYSTVHDWNKVREEAKTVFSHTLIDQLDASGFIKEFQLKPV